jgi:hypothetical protein
MCPVESMFLNHSNSAMLGLPDISWTMLGVKCCMPVFGEVIVSSGIRRLFSLR